MGDGCVTCDCESRGDGPWWHSLIAVGVCGVAYGNADEIGSISLEEEGGELRSRLG